VLGGKDIKTNNNNMKKNYKPGQILYIRSSMGPWYYISVLNHAAKHAHVAYESYELYTCCDLCVDADGSECLTFTRGNGSFLDLDTVFAEVREATNGERVQLFDALVKAFKDHDLGWANHFTDSSYFDILDWLSREFNVDFEDDSNQNHPLCEIISEIQDYIWDALCKETGNYHACTDYEEPEMVNKQEFIEKAKSWVKNCFVGPFDEGMANNIANEFEKYMEE
jgi:hypothetical protein